VTLSFFLHCNFFNKNCTMSVCQYILTRLSHLFFCSTYPTSMLRVNNKAHLHGSHVYSTTHRTKRSAAKSKGVRGVRVAGRDVITISISFLHNHEGYIRVAL
jgi:hypothetical protein